MVAGIAGYYVRKGLHGQTARTMLKIAIILFALTQIMKLSKPIEYGGDSV